MSPQTSLGSAECALASIAGASGQVHKQDLEAPHLPKQKACITIRTEEAYKSSDLVTFTVGASGLPKGCKRWELEGHHTVSPLPAEWHGIAAGAVSLGREGFWFRGRKDTSRIDGESCLRCRRSVEVMGVLRALPPALVAALRSPPSRWVDACASVVVVEVRRRAALS